MPSENPEAKQTVIELPQPSYWPIVLAFSLLLIASGIIFQWIISLVGVALLIAAIIGWAMENRARALEAEDSHG